MRRHGPHLLVVLFVSLALTLSITHLLAPSARAYTAPNKATTPIIFVHGYSDGLNCPSTDLTMWNTLINDLVEDGWTGPKRPVGFYSCDTNVSTNPNNWIDGHGSHNVYYSTSPCSPICSTHENGTSGHLSHNRNTDIRHLAYHLAWFIYDNYSKNGQTVEIAAHSMGGLIVRWMLYAFANPTTIGQNVFPPVLYVNDVYTVSTPHNGTSYAFLGGFYQAEEMQTNSSFMNAINGTASGRNPQGTNGTDWTTMGNYPSDSDLVVSDTSATHMDGGHKLLYITPRYSHGGSLNDNNEAWDAQTYRCDNCSATTSISSYRTITGMPHNDGYVDQAFYHGCFNYCWPSIPISPASGN